jgi:hypothetical protein
METRGERVLRYLRSQQRGIASLAVTAMMISGLVAVSRSIDPNSDLSAAPANFAGEELPHGVYEDADGTLRYSDGSVVRLDPNGNVLPSPRATLRGPKASRPPKVDPTIPAVETVQGVTDDTIEVVYYWKGERTQSSPFVKGTAAEGANLDEEIAFRAYVDYINKHANDGSTFFGIPINLHGRKLVPIVEAPKDAASGDIVYAQMAEKIAKEIKPFAAIASHGSLSSYICPYIAKFGIFNMQTYDLGGLGGNLHRRTNGYCTPSGLTWERQVDLTIGFLKKQMNTQYTREGVPEARKYGVIYTVYPGLKDVGEAMVQRLKDAGIPVVAHARLPDSLAQGQQEAQGVLLKMREAGANTLIMPEAGSPLTITHAAQAQGYLPDYYVWPCSGTDVTGMVRLFQPAQWQGAEGLTCYDKHFNPDAVNNNFGPGSEWWKAFKEVRPNQNPPAPAPLVYAGIAQLLAGISNAGPNLTPASFKAGIEKVPTFRYDTIEGRTDSPTAMLITMSDPDRAFIGDAAYLTWSSASSNGGAQGAYLYPEDRRYKTKADL